MSFGLPLRNGVSVGATSTAALGSWARTSVNDFRVAMPAGATYTRTGAATGETVAGLIDTFAANTPQRTDRGLALEPARTNLVINGDFANTGGAAPTNFTSGVGTGVSTPTTSTKNAEVTAYAQSATAERPFFGQTISVASGTTYSISMVVEEITGTLTAQSLLGYATIPAGATASFPVCSANPAGTSSGTVGVGLLVLQIVVAGTAGSVTLRFGIGCIGNATGTIRISCPRATVGTFPTSYIPTTTAGTATRGLPVFTETTPAGRTKALLTYADATTTLVNSLTPGGTFDVATSVISANKGRSGASELVSRVWYP